MRAQYFYAIYINYKQTNVWTLITLRVSFTVILLHFNCTEISGIIIDADSKQITTKNVFLFQYFMMLFNSKTRPQLFLKMENFTCSFSSRFLWLCSMDVLWRVRHSDFWIPWQRFSGAAEGERGPPASGERTKQMGLHTNNAKHQTQPAKEPGRHRRWNATQKRCLLMRLWCSFCLCSSAPRPRHTVDSKTSVYLIGVSGNCRKKLTEGKSSQELKSFCDRSLSRN